MLKEPLVLQKTCVNNYTHKKNINQEREEEK